MREDRWRRPRLTPLRGADGGRDGETAPGHPYYEFRVVDSPPPLPGWQQPPVPGRYLFQVKHHRTIDQPLHLARNQVVVATAIVLLRLYATWQS